MSKKRTAPLHPLILRLKAEAKKRSLTAYGLSQVTGLSVTTMHRLLTGNGSPTLDTLTAVAKALGIKIEGVPI